MPNDTKPVQFNFDCLNLCVETDGCDTVLFNYREQKCRLLERDPSALPQRNVDWEVLPLCALDAPLGEVTCIPSVSFTCIHR
jgi:hypothetical protein